MGTWGAGPFQNDAALDWAGEVLDRIVQTIDRFMEHPEIDESFDDAVAAIALLNVIMPATGCRPYRGDEPLDPEPVVAAVLGCFDEQIDGLEPRGTFKSDKRAALVAMLDEFARLLDEEN